MTVSSIRALLRVLIDQPSTNIWSTANLNTLIFSEYRNLINEITERNPDYYITSGSVSTTANVEFTDLPSTCTLLKKLTDSDGNTVKHNHDSQFDHTATSTEPLRFDVKGRKIWWNPKPDTVYTYTAYYHYQPTDLSADSDVPELPPNFHDILAYGAAVKSRLAKDEQIAEYMAIYEQKKQNLLHQIGISQTNNPRRVLRVYDADEE